MGLLQTQPLKGFYILYVLASTYFVAVPYWYLSYTLFGRQRKGWSLAEQVKILSLRRLQLILEHCHIALEIKDPAKEVAEDTLKESSFVWLKKPRSELITGALVHPVHKPLPQVAGYSWPKGAKLGEKEGKVLLFLHGGGYYVLNAGEKSPTSDLPRKLLQYSSVSSALSVEYRTLTYGGFPCQLQDSFAGYAHLVDTLGIDPKRIVVAGDSAGGHAALNLIRYLKDSQALPQPGHLLLFSPWSNMDISIAERPNKHFDYLRMTGLHYTPDMFLNNHLKGAEPVPVTSEYVSCTSKRVPATVELFKGFPKTFIYYGEAETLANDAQDLKQRMDKSGVDVTIREEPDGVHDSLTLDWFKPHHQRLAWQRICDWLDDVKPVPMPRPLSVQLNAN